MILARVVGEVWATRKHRRLQGYKLLVVRPYCWYEPAHEAGHLVAIDPKLDAGRGDDVIICMGAPPRWQSEGDAMPVEAAVMAVVDRCEIDEAAFGPPRPLEFLGGPPPTLAVGRIRTEPIAPGRGRC